MARWLVAAVALLGLSRVGAEEPPPDLDFLEYLGIWPAGDEEWLEIAGLERESRGMGRRERQRPPAGSEERGKPRSDDEDDD